MDYYGILGVSSTAELSEIKSKFKKLALLYHPDKPTGNDEKFKEINEAYKVLVNEKEREEYDRKRAESKSTYGYRSTNYSFFETVRREHERQQREMERERMAKEMERERIEREKRERKAREEMENRKMQEAEIQRRLEKIRLKEIEVERREKEIRRRRELEIKMEAMKLNNNSQQDDGMKTNQDPESSDNQSEQPEEEQESEEESDSTSSSDVISQQYYSPEESHSQYADFLEEEINNVQDQHSEEEQSDIEIIDTDTKGSKESPIVIDDDSATPGNSRATTSHKRRKTGYSAGPSNSNKKRKRIVSHGHRSANAAHVNKRHKSTNDERQLLFERIASAQTFPEFFAPSIDFETQCLHSLSEKIDLQILNDLQVVAERQLKLLKEFIAQYDHS